MSSGLHSSCEQWKHLSLSSADPWIDSAPPQYLWTLDSVPHSWTFASCFQKSEFHPPMTQACVLQLSFWSLTSSVLLMDSSFLWSCRTSLAKTSSRIRSLNLTVLEFNILFVLMVVFHHFVGITSADGILHLFIWLPFCYWVPNSLWPWPCSSWKLRHSYLVLVHSTLFLTLTWLVYTWWPTARRSSNSSHFESDSFQRLVHGSVCQVFHRFLWLAVTQLIWCCTNQYQCPYVAQFQSAWMSLGSGCSHLGRCIRFHRTALFHLFPFSGHRIPSSSHSPWCPSRHFLEPRLEQSCFRDSSPPVVQKCHFQEQIHFVRWSFGTALSDGYLSSYGMHYSCEVGHRPALLRRAHWRSHSIGCWSQFGRGSRPLHQESVHSVVFSHWCLGPDQHSGSLLLTVRLRHCRNLHHRRICCGFWYLLVELARWIVGLRTSSFAISIQCYMPNPLRYWTQALALLHAHNSKCSLYRWMVWAGAPTRPSHLDSSYATSCGYWVYFTRIGHFETFCRRCIRPSLWCSLCRTWKRDLLNCWTTSPEPRIGPAVLVLLHMSQLVGVAHLHQGQASFGCCGFDHMLLSFFRSRFRSCGHLSPCGMQRPGYCWSHSWDGYAAWFSQGLTAMLSSQWLHSHPWSYHSRSKQPSESSQYHFLSWYWIYLTNCFNSYLFYSIWHLNMRYSHCLVSNAYLCSAACFHSYCSSCYCSSDSSYSCVLAATARPSENSSCLIVFHNYQCMLA